MTDFELESGNRNVNRQTNGQINEQNYTNFERNLAMMVIYLPVKFEFDWTNHFQVWSPETKKFDGQTEILTDFELESGNGNVDGQTNGRTNGRNYTNFERNLAMMVIYLPVKFEFD